MDLGEERVLWLFADSWIDATGGGNRHGAKMISNSLGVQQGYDPSRSSIEFFWGVGSNGRPGPFFPGLEDRRFWPGNGVRVGDRLLLFLMEVCSRDDGIGFEVRDWTAVLVANPERDPPDWDLEWLQTPSNDLQVIVGSGGVLVEGDFVYAFGAQEPDSRHDVYLVRWREHDIREGRLEHLEWWGGGEVGWIGRSERGRGAEPVFRRGQTEFTVHYDGKVQSFVEFQTDGFGPAVVVRRSAPMVTGPWSAADTVFTPPQGKFPRIMIYQGKAHPHLVGADLVLTYCTNSFDFADHSREPWLYYPRFVRIAGLRSF